MKKGISYKRYFIVLCAFIAAAGVFWYTKREKWEPQVIEEEIVIKGLRGEYDLLFLTDTHIIVPDESDSGQIKENAEPRCLMFCNSEGVPSAEQFEEWMEYANEESLEGVLLGGDIIDYPSKANVQYLKNQLTTLNMPYLYTLGNHDWTYPWEYMTETGKETYLPMLDECLENNPAVHTLDYGEFVIVAVDNSGNQVNDAALEECEKILTGDKPVILLLHVPLCTQSVLTKAKEVWGEDNGVVLGAGNYGGIYPNETSKRFMDMVTDEDSPVEAVLAGHVHFYDRDMIEGEKDVLQIVGDAGYTGRALRIHISG